MIELPLFAACSSAPDFAIELSVSASQTRGNRLPFFLEVSVKILTNLSRLHPFLSNMKKKSSVVQKELMSLGHSYPKAKELYLREHLDDASLIEVLKQPNNILGIEYLKALLQLDSPIIPVCVTCVSNDHHSKELTPFDFFCNIHP